MYYEVTADFQDDPREMRPRELCYTDWAEAAEAIKRGLELGCVVIVALDHGDEKTDLGEEDPDTADWPSARHVVVTHPSKTLVFNSGRDSPSPADSLRWFTEPGDDVSDSR